MTISEGTGLPSGRRNGMGAGLVYDRVKQAIMEGRIAAAVITGDTDAAEAEARAQVVALCSAIAAANGKACNHGP